MLYFLLFAFSMVSAGEDITVPGFVEDNVLLPCPCSNRNLEKDFKWQLEEDKTKGTQTKLIFKYNVTSNVTDNRFKTFLKEDSSNCSILLKNITPDAQGKYRCSFHSGQQYKRVFVTLKICGRNISQYSQSTPSGEKVYHCNVTLDCYRKTDIQWTLNGRCLTNSATNIFTTFNNTGHYHFHSIHKTNSTSGPEPKCEVSSKCSHDSSGIRQQNQEPTQPGPDPYLRTLCKVVPVVLIFLLIWCRRRVTSHRSPSERDVENSDFSQTNTDSDELQSENVLSSEPEEVIKH